MSDESSLPTFLTIMTDQLNSNIEYRRRTIHRLNFLLAVSIKYS